MYKNAFTCGIPNLNEVGNITSPGMTATEKTIVNIMQEK